MSCFYAVPELCVEVRQFKVANLRPSGITGSVNLMVICVVCALAYELPAGACEPRWNVSAQSASPLSWWKYSPGVSSIMSFNAMPALRIGFDYLMYCLQHKVAQCRTWQLFQVAFASTARIPPQDHMLATLVATCPERADILEGLLQAGGVELYLRPTWWLVEKGESISFTELSARASTQPPNRSSQSWWLPSHTHARTHARTHKCMHVCMSALACIGMEGEVLMGFIDKSRRSFLNPASKLEPRLSRATVEALEMRRAAPVHFSRRATFGALYRPLFPTSEQMAFWPLLALMTTSGRLETRHQHWMGGIQASALSSFLVKMAIFTLCAWSGRFPRKKNKVVQIWSTCPGSKNSESVLELPSKQKQGFLMKLKCSLSPTGQGP
eukprot:1160337-Pelagomonas_calceolata.AAC.2